ncbi:hypothetical protein, partial [Planosporangium flavigriseum]
MAAGRVQRIPTAALAVAGFVAILVVRPGSPTMTATLTGVLTTGAAVLAAAVWLRAARWATGRAKLALRLLGIAMLGWAAGSATWINGYLTSGIDSATKIPPLAEIIFAVSMLLAPLAMVILFGNKRMFSIRTVLDALLIASALLYVAWAVVLGPLYHARRGSLTLSALAYPLADVVIASLVLILIRDAAPTMRVPARLVGAGVILMCVSDSTYAVLSAEGAYRPGGFGDLGWFLGFAVVAVAAPRRHELAGSAAVDEDESSSFLLPYLPFILALGTAGVLFVVKGGQIEPTLYVISTVLVILVVVRQLIVLRDNRALTDQLEKA